MIQTFYAHRRAWIETCNKNNNTMFSVGSSIKLTSNVIINEALHQYFGDKTYNVTSVINPKWELMPCDQYLTISGINGMFLNTIFENG